MAQLAGRSSVALHTIIYFNDRPTVTSASILKVRDTSIVVLVPKYGIEGVIDIIDKRKRQKTKSKKLNAMVNQYSYDEEKMALINNEDSSRSLYIFDEIKLKISVIDNGFCQQELRLDIVWDNDDDDDVAMVDASSSRRNVKKRTAAGAGNNNNNGNAKHKKKRR